MLPLSLPPVSSSLAPTAKSGTPSLFKSPMPATALPNLPPLCSDKICSEPPSVAAERTRVPLINSTYASPLPSAPLAPASRSASPSPSTSAEDAAEPNRSPMSPPASAAPISIVSLGKPSAFISIRCSAPASEPSPSSLLAPATMSCMPSPSMSPAGATDEPNSSCASSAGPSAVSESMVEDDFTLPSVFMNSTCAAPLLLLRPAPLSLAVLPTAKSCTPSESMSPMNATDLPNQSNCLTEPTLAVAPSIATDDFTVLS